MGKLTGPSSQPSDPGAKDTKQDKGSKAVPLSRGNASNDCPKSKDNYGVQTDSTKRRSKRGEKNPEFTGSMIEVVNNAAETARLVLDQAEAVADDNKSVSSHGSRRSVGSANSIHSYSSFSSRKSSGCGCTNGVATGDQPYRTTLVVSTDEAATAMNDVDNNCAVDDGTGIGDQTSRESSFITSETSCEMKATPFTPPPTAFQNLPMTRGFTPLHKSANGDDVLSQGKIFEVTNHFDAAAAISAALASSHLAQASGSLGELERPHPYPSIRRRSSVGEESLTRRLTTSKPAASCPLRRSHSGDALSAISKVMDEPISMSQAKKQQVDKDDSSPYRRSLPTPEEAEAEMLLNRTSFVSMDDLSIGSSDTGKMKQVMEAFSLSGSKPLTLVVEDKQVNNDSAKVKNDASKVSKLRKKNGTEKKGSPQCQRPDELHPTREIAEVALVSNRTFASAEDVSYRSGEEPIEKRNGRVHKSEKQGCKDGTIDSESAPKKELEGIEDTLTEKVAQNTEKESAVTLKSDDSASNCSSSGYENESNTSSVYGSNTNSGYSSDVSPMSISTGGTGEKQNVVNKKGMLGNLASSRRSNLSNLQESNHSYDGADDEYSTQSEHSGGINVGTKQHLPRRKRQEGSKSKSAASKTVTFSSNSASIVQPMCARTLIGPSRKSQKVLFDGSGSVRASESNNYVAPPAAKEKHADLPVQLSTGRGLHHAAPHRMSLFDSFDRNWEQAIQCSNRPDVLNLGRKCLASFSIIFGSCKNASGRSIFLGDVANDNNSKDGEDKSLFRWWVDENALTSASDIMHCRPKCAAKEQAVASGQEENDHVGIPIVVIRTLWKACFFDKERDGPEQDADGILDLIQHTLVKDLCYLTESPSPSAPCLRLSLDVYAEYGWYILRRFSMQDQIAQWHLKFSMVLRKILHDDNLTDADTIILRRYAVQSLPRHTAIGFCAVDSDCNFHVDAERGLEHIRHALFDNLLCDKGFIKSRAELLGRGNTQQGNLDERLKAYGANPQIARLIKQTRHGDRNILFSTMAHMKDMEWCCLFCIPPQNEEDKTVNKKDDMAQDGHSVDKNRQSVSNFDPTTLTILVRDQTGETTTKAKYDSVIGTHEARSRQHSKEAQELKEEIARSDTKHSQLLAQLSTLTRERDELTTKVEGVTQDLAKANHDSEEEKLVFGQRDAARAQQIRSLKEQVEQEGRKAAETSRDQLEIISRQESDLEGTHLQLEKERSTILALEADLAKSKADAIKSLEEFGEERLGFSQKVRDLEKHHDEEKKKASASAEDQLAITATLEERIAVMESGQENLCLELKNKCSTLASIKSEIDELALELEEANAVITYMEKDKKTTAAMLNSLKASCEKLQIENETLSADHANLQSQREDAAAKLAAIDAEHTKCWVELESVINERDEVESELSDVKAMYEDSMKSHEESIQQNTSEVHALEESIKTLTEERDQLATKVEEVTSELQSAQMKLLSEVRALTKEVEESQKYVSQSEVLCADLKTKLEVAETHLDGRNNEIRRLEKQVNDLNVLKDENKALNNELANMSDEKEAMSSQLKSKHSDIESLTVQLSKISISHQLNTKQSENDDLNERLRELTSQVCMKEELHSLSQNMCAHLKEKLETAEAHSNEVKALNEQICGAKEKVAAKLDEVVGRLDEVLNSNEHLAAANKNLTRLLNAEKVALEEARLDMNKLKEESSSATATLLEQVSELRVARASAEERAVALENNLDADRMAAATKLEVLEDKLKASANSNEQLTNQLASLQNEIKDLLLQKADEIQDAESVITGLKEEMSQTKERSSGEVKTFASENQSLTAELSSIRCEHEYALNTKQSELNILESRMRKLTKQFQTKEEIISSSQINYDSAIEGLTRELEAANAEQCCLEGEADKLNIQHDEKIRAERARSLEERLAVEEQRALEKHKNHSSTVAKLEERLVSAKSEKEHLRSEVERERKAYYELYSQLSKAEKDAHGVSKALEAERLSFKQRDDARAEQVHALEEDRRADRQRFFENAKEQTAVIAELEGRIAAAEAERDDLCMELDSERLALAAASKAKEDACVSLKESEEGRVSLRQRSASQEKLLCDLEGRLHGEQRKTKDQLAIITTLREHITIAECDRDDTRSEMENERSAMSSLVESLEGQLVAQEAEHRNQVKTLNQQIGSQQEAATKLAQVEGRLDATVASNVQLIDQVSSLKSSHEHVTKLLKEKESALDEARTDIATLKEESSLGTAQLQEEISQLRKAREAAEERVVSVEGRLTVDQISAAAKLVEVRDKLEDANESNAQLTEKVASLENAKGDMSKLLLKRDVALEEAESAISALKEELSRTSLQSFEKVGALHDDRDAAKARVAILESELEAEQMACQELKHQVESFEDDVVRLTKKNHASNEIVDNLQSEVTEITSSKEKLEVALEDARQCARVIADEKKGLSRHLSDLQEKYDFLKLSSANKGEELREKITVLEDSNLQRDQEAIRLKEKSAQQEQNVLTVSSERDDLAKKLESTFVKLKLVEKQSLSHLSRIEEMQSEFDCLTDKARRNEGTILQLKDENQSLKTDLKSKEAENSRLTDRVRDLANEVETQASFQTKLGADAQKILEDLEASRSECFENKSLLVDLRSKLESAELCMRTANTERQSLVRDREDLEEQVNHLHVLLENSEESASQQRFEIESLTSNLSSMTSARDKLCSEKDSNAKELDMKAAEISSLSASIHKLTSQISSGDADKSELLSKVSLLEEDLAKSNSRLEAQQASLKAKNSEFRLAEDESQSKFRAYELRQSELLSTIDVKESIISKLASEVQHIETQSRRESLSHEVILSQLRNDIRALQNCVSASKIKCTHLAGDLEAVRDSLSAKESELHMTICEKESVATEFETSAKAFRSTENQLRSSLQTLEHQVQSEREKSSSKEQALLRLEAKLNRCRQASTENEAKLAAEILAAKDAEKDLRNQLRVFEISLIEKDKELSTSKDELDELRNAVEEQLSTREQEIDKMKGRLKSMGEHISHTESTFASEKGSLHDKIDQQQALIHSISEEKDTVMKKIDQGNQARMLLQSELAKLSKDLASAKRDIAAAFTEAAKTAERVIKQAVKSCEAENEASSSLHASEMASLLQKMGGIESKNMQMQTLIHQQDLTVSRMNRQVSSLQEQCNNAKEERELSMTQWTAEKTSYENKIQSLLDEVSEKSTLNKSPVATLEQRETKFDAMPESLNKLSVTNKEHSPKQSQVEELNNKLISREELIGRLSMDLSLAQDEIVRLAAEVECSKEICSTREEMEGKWQNFRMALHSLASFARHRIDDLPLEESLPEMTSLLKSLIDLFQEKADQAAALQSQIQDMSRTQADKASELESLVGEINSIEDHSDALKFKDELDTIANEVRNLCLQMELQVAHDLTLPQMLQSLKLHAIEISAQQSDPDLDDSREHQQQIDLLSEIEEARRHVEEMDRKLESEVICRNAREEALAEAEERITSLEELIREMDESTQTKAADFMKMESQIEQAQGHAKLKSKEAKDMESRLQQTKKQLRKSELKYERAEAEIESCQKLTVDLKTRIIDKNQEIKSKENTIMELQYKIDELSCSFEGMMADDGNAVSSPQDAAILASSTKRHDSLSTEIAKLEEKIVRMDEEHRQQSEMNKAIVEGLESQCEILSDENADIYDELREKNTYICTLEEAKEQNSLQGERLRKDCEEKCRKLSDLKMSLSLLRQQKMDSEASSNEVISAVKKLARTVIVHTAKIEEFSSNALSPSTWSENLEIINTIMERLVEKYLLDMEKSRGSSVADAITPKAKGANGSMTRMIFASHHSDMLEDLKNMKNAIASVMSSPKLTPTKPGRQEDNIQRNDDFDEDLYSDLLRAHEQLESLSKRIEVFRDQQMQWEERESYFESRILELEEENILMKTTPPILSEIERVKMKEVGIVMMSNFTQRYRRTVLKQAFQTWSSKAHMSKHLAIAKEMAKELTKTREKVLLLKSHLDDSS